MTTPFTKIQLRNGTFQEWRDSNPILAQGEPGFEINTGRLKIGDGIRAWNDLEYMSCCPLSTPAPSSTPTTPTPTPTLGINTIFISWEDCFGAGSLEQIPNKFGHFDLCGLPCPVSKDIRFYFQNNLEELNKRTKDLLPYSEDYNYTCDTVDGNNTIVLRVEKGNGLKLEIDNLVECTKPKPICNCSCCPTTPAPTPNIPDCISYGGIKLVLSACHGCDAAKYNLYVGDLISGVWDDSKEVFIEEINLNSFDSPNVVSESPYPCDGGACCVQDCAGYLSVREVNIPAETISELSLIASEENCITIPVKLKCLLGSCHSDVTKYIAFSEGGCCVGQGTLDSNIDSGNGTGVQTINICCGACSPTPTPTSTPSDDIWNDAGCISGVVYDISSVDTSFGAVLLTDEQLSILTPSAYVSLGQFNIPTRNWSSGFPGSPSLQEWFQINFTSNLQISTPGEYNIKILSDDGVKLWIDDNLIISNDGVHPPSYTSQNINLSSGVHTFKLNYFQGPRAQIALVAYWTPPGGIESVIPESAFVCSNECNSNCDSNLILNGSFELGDPGSFGGGGTITHWTQSNVDIHSLSYDPLHNGEPLKRWVDLNALSPGYIQQNINTVIGRTYTIFFRLAANNFKFRDVLKTCRLYVIGSSTLYQDYTFDASSTSYGTYEGMGWINNTYSFVADSNSCIIKFESTCAECTSCGPAIDCVEVCEAI